MTPLDFMQIQAATLFKLDARGRILAINEQGAPDPPRLFLGRTAAGHVLHLRHDLSGELAAELEAIALAEPLSADLEPEPACLAALVAALERHAPVTQRYRGPAFFFPEQIAALHGVTPIDADNATLVRDGFGATLPLNPAIAPVLAAVQDAMAVAVCFSSRRTATACEAGLEVLPNYRRRGYALRVTAAWALAVRADGRLPLYSTEWENVASRGVARGLGLTLYGDDLDLW